MIVEIIGKKTKHLNRLKTHFLLVMKPWKFVDQFLVMRPIVFGRNLVFSIYRKTKFDISIFSCNNGRCIYRSRVCDHINHCGDESDEDLHGVCQLPNRAVTCPEFRCVHTNRCIRYSDLCDECKTNQFHFILVF